MNNNYNSNFNNNFNNNNLNNNYNNINQYQNQNSFNIMNNSNQNLMQNNMANSEQNLNQNIMPNSPQINNQNLMQQQMSNSNGNLQINNFNNINQYNQNKNSRQINTQRNNHTNQNQMIQENFKPPSQRSLPVNRPQQFNNGMDNFAHMDRQFSQPQNYNIGINNNGNFNNQNNQNNNNAQQNSNDLINPLKLIMNSGKIAQNNNNPQFNNISNMNNNQNLNSQENQQNQMNYNIDNNNNMPNFINQGQNNNLNQKQPLNNLIQNNQQQNSNQDNQQQNINQDNQQQNINQDNQQQNINQYNQQPIKNPYCKNDIINKEPIIISEEGRIKNNPSIDDGIQFKPDPNIMNLEKDIFISLTETIPLESVNKINNLKDEEEDKKEKDKKEEKNDNKQMKINHNEEEKYTYQGATPRFIDNNNFEKPSLPQLNDYIKNGPNNFSNEDSDDFQLLKSVKKKPEKNLINNNIQNNNNITEKETMLTNKGDEDEPRKYPIIGGDEQIANKIGINKDIECAPDVYTNKGDEDLTEKYKKEEKEINKNKINNQEKDKKDNESIGEEELGINEIEDDDNLVISRKENDLLFPVVSVMESVQISEDFTKNIHNHSLSKESLSNETCTICFIKKTCENGFKCKNCSLNICEECSTKININEFDNRKHKHRLTLLNEENCKCNNCNKDLKSKVDFYFNCKQCNFYMCLNCYNPDRKEKEEDESIHEHPLQNVSELRTQECKLCENDTNSGVVCDNCDLLMCQNCAANVYKRKFKKDLHEHPLYLTVRDDWKCKECGSSYTDKISFHCKKCSVDICADCYME